MKRKRYTKVFKRQLVALIAQGRMPKQLSREYETTSQTVRNWVHEAQKHQPASELEKDRQIRDLKAENARLREKREILGKAAA
jgi:transposase